VAASLLACPTMLARALIGDHSDFAVTRCGHQDLDAALSKGAKHNHDTIKKIPRPSIPAWSAPRAGWPPWMTCITFARPARLGRAPSAAFSSIIERGEGASLPANP
jgi:hypothetical protein